MSKDPIGRVHKLLTALVSAAALHLCFAADTQPSPAHPFGGKISFSTKDSIPDWPQPVKAKKGAPNIVLILLDDVGFAATATFGGPVQTPELDKLAAQGLRFNRFHVSAVCSATRAALLTGRNDHRVNFGVVPESATGFPGYNGIWPKSAASVAEVLRRNGYNTAAFGKWHNTPLREITPIGPFDRWPTGLGFEYFYGFMRSEDSQWEPSLYRNTTPVDPAKSPGNGYHFTTDITDEAINWLRTHESLAPERPYFLYFAPGATHGPHHVPREWIAGYRGMFDQGWDKLREEIFARQKQLGVIPNDTDLTPRPKELPAWDSMSPDEKRLLAHQMEVFAGFMAQTDYEVGRLIRAAQQAPGGDNTLILYIVGDNGADAASGRWGLGGGATLQDRLRSMEELGGPSYFNNYASGWAWATSTPFKWEKDIASHFGGSRDPLIAAWPAQINDHGGLRSQFTHVNDVAPTLYEIAGIRFPSIVDGVPQLRLDGVSFAYTFKDHAAPSRHHVQIFEQDGNRSIYQDGWIAAARHTVPWIETTSDDFAHDQWELYHIDKDFSEAHDLAARYPKKLRDLKKLFDVEARTNNIYPLSITPVVGTWPKFNEGKSEFVYYPGLPRLSAEAAPNFSRSHRITANVVIPESGAQGVIISDGTRAYGGFSLYVKDDRLVYENHPFDAGYDVISSQGPLPHGNVEVAYEFDLDESKANTDASGSTSGPGTGRLYINSKLVGEGAQGPVTAWGPLGIGLAFVSPVSRAFQLPFKFSGTLEQVTVDLK